MQNCRSGLERVKSGMRAGGFFLAAALLLGAALPAAGDDAAARGAMVDLLAAYDPAHRVFDARVLAAMRKVPRHLFVPDAVRAQAYVDSPLPIGSGQTISQPFIVGTMTQALELKTSDKVFEVGTGSGYQAAILAELVHSVYSVEIVPVLARRAEATLKSLGYTNARVKAGDGYQGWPEHAPFDAIIVTCAPDHIPEPLVRQLKLGGRMIIPFGPDAADAPWTPQELILVRKTKDGMKRDKVFDVRFVPMTGEAQKKKK